MTGHLLVFRIQWPRRPGLFPQLHVWVPVRRGWDERTEFTGGPTNIRTGRVGMWWPDHHHPAVPSLACRQMAQGSGCLRDGGRMALFPHWTGDQPKTQPQGLAGWLTGCSHCAGAAPKSTSLPQGQPTVQHVWGPTACRPGPFVYPHIPSPAVPGASLQPAETSLTSQLTAQQEEGQGL